MRSFQATTLSEVCLPRILPTKLSFWAIAGELWRIEIGCAAIVSEVGSPREVSLAVRINNSKNPIAHESKHAIRHISTKADNMPRGSQFYGDHNPKQTIGFMAATELRATTLGQSLASPPGETRDSVDTGPYCVSLREKIMMSVSAPGCHRPQSPKYPNIRYVLGHGVFLVFFCPSNRRAIP